MGTRNHGMIVFGVRIPMAPPKRILLSSALFALLIFLSSYVSIRFGSQSVLGFSFTLGLFFSTPLMWLRDFAQEQGSRWWPTILSIPAYAAIYFYATSVLADGEHRAACTIIAVFWTLLLDRNLYLWFRRFGWAAGMIFSDLISVPMLTIFFWYLYADDWSGPDGQILLKYLTMAVGYGIIFSTGMLDKHISIPRWIRLPRERWFKYFD